MLRFLSKDWFRRWFSSIFARRGRGKPSELSLQRRETRKDSKKNGAFATANACLDDAERRFAIMKKLRWPSDSVMGAAKAIGINVTSAEGLSEDFDDGDVGFSSEMLERIEGAGRPNVLFSWREELGIEDNENKVYFCNQPMCFRKVSRYEAARLNVQQLAHGTILYESIVGLTDLEKKSDWFEIAYFSVRPDGTIFFPKFLVASEVRLPVPGDPLKRPNRPRSYMQKAWRARKMPGDRDKLKASIAIAFNSAQRQDFNWSFNVCNGEFWLRYQFADNDAPYFFKDRKVRGKRVYHAVKAHERTKRDGDTTFVKTHYRGSRHWEIDGMQCVVQMPGKHRGLWGDLPQLRMQEDLLRQGVRDVREPGDISKEIPGF